MKVGLLVPGGVDRSGEERVIPCLLWLIERLAAEHEVHVFAFRQQGNPFRYRLLGSEVHVARGRPRKLRMAAAILAEHRRGPFALLHAFWALPSGVVGAFVARLTGTPLLLHITGGDLAAVPEIDYGALNSRRGRWWLRRAAGGASYVTTPSLEMQRRAARLGIATERLPLGVALDRWPPRPPRRRDVSQPARLIHVASLNPVKDQATMVRAVRHLEDRGCRFHLDIVGRDTLGGRIQRTCREYAVDGLVGFHGHLLHGGLRPLMDRAHLLVMSSLHEADPIVLLEAAVAGVPAVSTAVGHALDWAPDRARVVSVGDDAGLAREILDLLSDEEERLRIAARAQRQATSEDADWSAGRILAIYDRLAAAGERRRSKAFIDSIP